jgi:glutathione reductase (NADPH)
MYNAATLAHTLSHDATHYGFEGGRAVADSLNFSKLKQVRDAYVKRLNGIYASGFQKVNVEDIRGVASLVNGHSVELEPLEGGAIKSLTAKYILVATGGRPLFPEGEGIAEHCISSDGFFDLESLPKVAVVVGAGYIAVELAGVLNSLGSEVHLVVRKERALREFDELVSSGLDEEMIKAGIRIHRYTKGVASVTLGADHEKKTITTHSGDSIYGADVVIMAVGRVPTIEGLGLDKAGVTLTNKGYIQVDEYQNTSCESIFALGDVCGQVELTPMAIAAGRRLADRIFGNETLVKPRVSYENVPTVIFSHPPIGTIGLSETKARDFYGTENIKVYKSLFANLFYGIFDVDASNKPKTRMKVVCAGDTEKVVGIHCIGMGVDEMMQGTYETHIKDLIFFVGQGHFCFSLITLVQCL